MGFGALVPLVSYSLQKCFGLVSFVPSVREVLGLWALGFSGFSADRLVS